MKLRRRVTYRSGLEDKVHEQLTKKKVSFEYEPFDKKIVYTIPESVHKYTPDFILTTATGKTIYVETKGIWDSDDRKKHLLIRQQHPEIDLRFVFTRSKARIRKGSKTTYADICQGNGRGSFKNVVWKFSDKLIPEEWWNE